MILLDTNVVSETMRANPDPKVVAWLNAQSSDTIYLSTISLAELLLGIAVLPGGRRKSELAFSLGERVEELFGSRLVSFDAASAEAYAALVSRARAGGKSIGLADGLIASIAITRGFAIATRDVSPFAAAGIVVINTWVET